MYKQYVYNPIYSHASLGHLLNKSNGYACPKNHLLEILIPDK